MQRELNRLERGVTSWRTLEKDANDLAELAALEDATLAGELEEKLAKLETQFRAQELTVMLRGKYDADDALLSIHAGTGGLDAQDFAAMLERMYVRYAESQGYKTEIIDRHPDPAAGIKSVTLLIKGDYAYGFLKAEVGVHRLVRQSPFNANDLRQTSFALVEVVPDIPDTAEVAITPADLEIQTFRASSAGGQHVNKTDSAVRIIHKPTGLMASSQSERSQHQNKEHAMKMLRGKLFLLDQEKLAAEKKTVKGSYKEAKWGNQIRSYVVHPYKQVKDHRTEYVEKNAQKVFDGGLQPFIEAWLRAQLGNVL